MDASDREQRRSAVERFPNPGTNPAAAPGEPIEAFWAFDEYYEILEDARATGGAYSLLRHIFPGGHARTPLHFHKRTTEVITVERGPVRVHLDGAVREHPTGDVITIPVGAVHGVAGSDTGITSILVRSEPAGIESALRQFGRPHDMPKDPAGPDAMQQLQRLIAMGEAHDVYVVQ